MIGPTSAHARISPGFELREMHAAEIADQRRGEPAVGGEDIAKLRQSHGGAVLLNQPRDPVSTAPLVPPARYW